MERMHKHEAWLKERAEMYRNGVQYKDKLNQVYLHRRIFNANK